MASSRIFVKGIPPNITEADFRKHFSANNREVTDVKVIPQRRIGYVGFKTPEEASKAIKYFNKSYIRMSKISVESARPVRRPFAPVSADPNARLDADGMLDLRPVIEQPSLWPSDPDPVGQKESARAGHRRHRRGGIEEEETRGWSPTRP
jgi:RNA recognition motif-containing protein